MKRNIIKLLTLVCFLLAVTALFSVSASAATDGDYTYTVSGGKATITNCKSTCTDGNIPSKLGGYPVVAIADNALWYCKMTNVVIPEGVTTIGREMFGQNTVVSLSLPSTLTSIPNYAFNYFSNLKTINIPENVKSIGAYAFSYCIGLTNIRIPSSVESIGEWAFWGCKRITTITFENGLKSIGEIAFYGCESLKSITLPDSVTSVGAEAFARCTRLESAVLSQNMKSIPNDMFYNCTKLKSVTIYEGIESIGEEAFCECVALTSLHLPSTVKSLGKQAFGYCDKLADINIPHGITTLSVSLFAQCFALKNITLPDSITSIGESAFSGCTSLSSIVIPAGVKSISRSTFYSCYELTSVALPDGITDIGRTAFVGCEKLVNITLPDSVQTIGESAFEGCDNLQDINIPSKVTSIEDSAFAYCPALIRVTYCGTPESWAKITIASGNTALINADRVYHRIESNVVESTCTESGSKVDVCVLCGNETCEEIPAAGHDMQSVDDKASTCTESGWKDYTICSRCDYNTYTEIPSLGHDLGDWSVSVEATDISMGEMTRGCSRCEYSETQITDKIEVTDGVYGDLDRDGSFTNTDITLLVRHLMGIVIWNDGGYASLSDVNEDGLVNNRDAIALILIIAEETKFDGFTEITTVQELAAVRNDLSGKYYLGADITLTGEWTLIGTASSPFTGIFDGNGYTISGLSITINKNVAVDAGLFGRNSGEIRNLTIVGSINVNTTAKAKINAGGVAGVNTGVISNCHSSVAINCTSESGLVYAGGIAGYSSGGSIKNCTYDAEITTSSATISGCAYAGGICGYSEKSAIYGCENHGTVFSDVYAAGIVSQPKGGTVVKCSNNGTVSALASKSTHAGGIAAVITDGAVVERCENHSDIKSSVYAGGIVGRNYAVVRDCLNTGDVEATLETSNAYAGGIVGHNTTDGSCVRSFSSVKSTAHGTLGYAGSVAGYNQSATSLVYCYYIYDGQAGCGRGTDGAMHLTVAQSGMQMYYLGLDFASVWTIEGGVLALK